MNICRTVRPEGADRDRRRALAEPKERPRTSPTNPNSNSIPLVGRSPAMQEIYRVLARLMQTDLTVMFPANRRKELVARALHDYGKAAQRAVRRGQQAAIPRDLIESRTVRP